MAAINPLPKVRRQAVVVVHGIGEQKPMDTLRDFVDMVAPEIRDSQKPKYYSKPVGISESSELRRLTANEHRDSFKTDFFEFYWANHISSTKLSDVWNWMRNLFLRTPSIVPKRLLAVYVAFWLTISLTVIFFILTASYIAAIWNEIKNVVWLKVLAGFVATLISAFFSGLLANYLGDAVRYMTPLPGNIDERQRIRDAGIALLRKLHETDTNGTPVYDRVIIVGHSLGSVIAYDLLRLFWIEQNAKLELTSTSDISKVEAACLAFANGNISLDQFQHAQFEFWSSQRTTPESWKISDLITLGSPLAFAGLYLGDEKHPLPRKTKEREFPTSPPVFEHNDLGEAFFSFPPDKKSPMRRLHHAAMFSMTRWTNIYFDHDYVGGPITEFGPGIQNRQLTARKLNWLPFWSHTKYWHSKETNSRSLLLRILDLRFQKQRNTTE